MFKKLLTVILGLTVTFCFANNGFTEELTAKLCKEKVIAAAKLLEQIGEKAFDTIKDPDGEFRFANGSGYIWIHSLDSIMLMHPLKSSLNGKNLATLKDPNGILFFAAMNETVEEYGAGWVGYLWPKAGESGASPKISYVKLANHGGVGYVAGAGMYDVTVEDIQKQFPKDAIYED